MMYSEFIEAVGCPDRDTNIVVFERLDKIYMNDDTFTKEDFIEWGKKLADFSISEAVLKERERIKNTIKDLQEEIKSHKNEIEMIKFIMDGCGDKDEYRLYKSKIAWYNDQIKKLRREVNELKSLLQ